LVATTSRNDKVARLRDLGAQDVICGDTAAEVADQVLRLTNGAGADHVIEVGGQGTLSHSLRAVRDGGTISLIGGLARPVAVVLSPMVLRNIRVQGISVGSRAMFERMLAAYGSGLPAPVIDRIFAFDEAPLAFTHLEGGQHVGKVVIRVGAASAP
jgi:NADPH:quinone reductase-like Zn-dependent oxidoreductase